MSRAVILRISTAVGILVVLCLAALLFTLLPTQAQVPIGGPAPAVRIERGKFRMGSPPGEAGRGNDELQHEVEIAKPFSLGVFPVTQAQYEQVMGTRPSQFSPKGGGKDRVVGLNTRGEQVPWGEAR